MPLTMSGCEIPRYFPGGDGAGVATDVQHMAFALANPREMVKPMAESGALEGQC